MVLFTWLHSSDRSSDCIDEDIWNKTFELFMKNDRLLWIHSMRHFKRAHPQLPTTYCTV